MNVVKFYALVGTLSTFASAAEVKLKVSELPPAVQTAIEKNTEGSTVVGASKEREKGRVEYEVETQRDGKRRDVVISEDGSLLEVEEEVDLASLPEAARRAIQQRARDGKIKKVESVTRGSEVTYEATVARKGRDTEVAVNADGTSHRED